MMKQRVILLLLVHLVIPGVLVAAEYAAKPTVFLDNLQEHSTYVFYVFLMDQTMGDNSPQTRNRWTIAVSGKPVEYPADFLSGTRGKKGQALWLFAVPQAIAKTSEAPESSWFDGSRPEIKKVGEIPSQYTRDDMGGQIAKVFHFRVQDFALKLVSEHNEYNWADYIREQSLYAAVFVVPILLLTGLCFLIRSFLHH